MMEEDFEMDGNTDLYEVESLTSSQACYYAVMGSDSNIPLYTLTETPPYIGHIVSSEESSQPSSKENKSVDKKFSPKQKPGTSLDHQHFVANVYNTEDIPDVTEVFSETQQILYQAQRNEKFVPLYEVKPSEVTDIRAVSPSSDGAKGKTSKRNRERRKRQRERMKNMKADQETPKEVHKDRKSPQLSLNNKSQKTDRKSPGKEQNKKPSPKVDVKLAKKAQSEKSSSKTPEDKGKKTPPLKGKSGKSTPSSEKAQTPRLHRNEARSTPDRESDVKFNEKVSLLEKDFIYPLKKKSIKFPRAKFFCRLCDYHCDDTGHAYRHIKDNRHQNNKNARVRDFMLGCLPAPSKIHTDAVTEVLTHVLGAHTLTEEDIANRHKIVHELRLVMNEKCPEATLRLYGSSINGFGLKCSDVNVELKAEKAPMALKELYLLLKQSNSGYFTRVKSDFSATVPCVLCDVPSLSLFVKIGVTSPGVTLSSSYLTSQLLKAYCSIDPRVGQLGVPFRLWAQFCGIDDQDSGTLPAYVFGLMTVFFLQQCDQPVLPVLHMVGEPKDRNAGAPDNFYFNDLKNLNKFWTCENTESSGSLWIKMLQFYALKMDMREIIVSIRSKELINRNEKKWTKRLAIEDPFQRKRNISRSISHSQVFDYIYDQLRNLYQYFGIPQTKQGPVFKDIDHAKIEEQLVQLFRERSPRKNSPVPVMISRTPTTPGRSQSQKEEEESGNLIKSASQDLIGDSDEEDESTSGDVYTYAASLVKSALSDGINQSVQSDTGQTSRPECIVTSLFDSTVLKDLTTEDLTFVFEEDVLCDGKNPPLICALCHKHGHLQQNCPDVQLPALTPLPPVSKKYRIMLDTIIHKVPHDFEPSVEETSLRGKLCYQLERYIRNMYPDAKLSLFGSSCNGFGFSHSDMDICMVLEKTDSDKVNYVEVINKLAKHLKQHNLLADVFAITTAKVPIVKFKHKQSGLEGDISLYNTLAVHNTQMLNMYTALDPRVRALGYTMKVFAKLCDICDASKGSLSSYAYILMVIYFLQQRNPPVIPVLQELYQGEKPLTLVDGWNAWFYGDMDSIARVWPEYRRNKESLAELWIGMLRFYTEEFNFKDYVISIRQKMPLTRFEKLWNGKCVAIEDPFDLSHNLGGGLSRKMDAYIMKAFHNGRLLFGTSVNQIPNGYMTLEDYLFDPKLLTDTAPPTDRNCRICKKIGHWARQCPSNNKGSDHKENSNTPSPQQQKKSNAPTNKTPEGASAAKDLADSKLSRKKGKQSDVSNSQNTAGHSSEAKGGREHQKGTKRGHEVDRTPKQSAQKNKDVGGSGDSGRSNKVNGSVQRNQQQQQQHQIHKARVFYNKQRSAEPVPVSPRNLYLNNQPSPVQPLMSMNFNPVQQLFNNYSTPQPNLPPMPLMAVQVGPPGHQQHAPLPRDRTVQLSPPSNYNMGGGLTWQQQQLQQHMSQSGNRRRNRKSFGSGEDYDSEFPNLEVTIQNEQFTWQQQQLTQSPKKKRRNTGGMSDRHSSPRH